MVFNVRISSSKYNLFHKTNLFCSCIIHILYIGCAKIKKNISGAKRLMTLYSTVSQSVIIPVG